MTCWPIDDQCKRCWRHEGKYYMETTYTCLCRSTHESTGALKGDWRKLVSNYTGASVCLLLRCFSIKKYLSCFILDRIRPASVYLFIQLDPRKNSVTLDNCHNCFPRVDRELPLEWYLVEKVDAKGENLVAKHLDKEQFMSIWGPVSKNKCNV